VKKVLFLITHNDNGGAQNAIVKMKDLICKDFDCEVVSLYQIINGVDLNCLVKSGEVKSCLKYFIAFYRLFNFVKQRQPDTIISFLPLANLFGSLISRFFGKSSFISHRNPVTSYSKFMRVSDYFFSKLRVYDKIICNSNSVRQSIHYYPCVYEKKTYIVNNYAVKERELYSKSALAKRLGIDLECEFALAVGRLSEQKRFDILIDSFIGLEKNLVIAGTGELSAELRVRAGSCKNIVFLGHCDALTVASLMSYCKLYLQPSLYEGQSNSLLEVLQYDCIIVSSDIPPQREVLVSSNLYGGILVSDFDVSIWRQEIKKAFSISNDVFMNAKLHIRNLYSEERVKKQISELI